MFSLSPAGGLLRGIGVPLAHIQGRSAGATGTLNNDAVSRARRNHRRAKRRLPRARKDQTEDRVTPLRGQPCAEERQGGKQVNSRILASIPAPRMEERIVPQRLRPGRSRKIDGAQVHASEYTSSISTSYSAYCEILAWYSFERQSSADGGRQGYEFSG